MIKYSSYDVTLTARDYLGRLEAEYRELLRLRERVREAEATVALSTEGQGVQPWKGLRPQRDN